MSKNIDYLISQPLSSEEEVEMPSSVPLSSDIMQPPPSAPPSDAIVTPRVTQGRPPTRRARRGGRAGRRAFGRNPQSSSDLAKATPSPSSTPTTPKRGGRPRKQIATPQDLQSLSPRRTRSERRSTDSDTSSRGQSPLFQDPPTPKGSGRSRSRETTPVSRPTTPLFEIPTTPTRRGPGRPTTRETTPVSRPTTPSVEVQVTPTRKGPGRPRKLPTPSVVATSTPTTPKRGRGRPPAPNSTPRDRTRRQTPVTTPQPSTSAAVYPQSSASAAVHPQPSTSAQADAADAAARSRPQRRVVAPVIDPQVRRSERLQRNDPLNSPPPSSSSSSIPSSGSSHETEAERLRRYRQSQNDPDWRARESQNRQQRRRNQSPLGAQIVRVLNAARMRVHHHQNRQQRARTLQEFYDDFIRRNAIRNGPPKFHENTVEEYLCGAFNVVCRFCNALHFALEASRLGDFKSCCRFGAVRLDNPARPYPGFLRDALTSPTNFFNANLRQYIRNYNSALSYVSLGANLRVPESRGPYCFIVQGTVYHYMTNLSVPNTDRLTYAQLYFMDSDTQAADMRLSHPANRELNRILLRDIQDEIRGNSIYARVLFSSYQRMQNYLNDPRYLPEAPRPQLVFNRDFSLRDVHPGRQNEPAAGNEIAAVFVMEGDEGTPPFHRDFSISHRLPNDNRFTNINVISTHLDPLTYALLFPYGDPGWHVGWTCNPYPGGNVRARRVTLQNYRAAQMQDRRNDDRLWRPIVHSGNLFQQFVVDAYLGVEANNLTWIRLNQDAIWAQRYDGLNNWIQEAAAARNIPAAPAVILPSSFTGSVRNMQQLCKDAMAIFGRLGKPDLFITFTCNPQWEDVIRSLGPSEKVHDRPDIVSRVFKLKLKELMNDIKTGLLGTIVGFVYTIEFQKRGLPHAHILVTLQQGSKPIDADSIDRIVCAELPDPVLNPRLHAIVNRVMTHGPCRGRPCGNEMVNGICQKGFPKPFRHVTCVISNNYPNYRRVDTPALQGANGFIVPYNPYLALKYNAHINVEVLTTMHSAIQYVYKYIFKGYDVANLVVNQQGQLGVNELFNYMSARYVSAPEAIWRLFEFETHERSHAVERLPVHLEANREIDFPEDVDDLPPQIEHTLNTKLDAFFALNIIRSNTFQDQQPQHQPAQDEPVQDQLAQDEPVQNELAQNEQAQDNIDQDPQQERPQELESQGDQVHRQPLPPLLYSEVPILYTWQANERRWRLRQRGADKVVSRIHEAGGANSEIFALRMLLLNVRGPKSFKELRTVNRFVHATFLNAARARQLLPNTHIVADTLLDMSVLRRPPALRGLFVMLAINFKITDGNELFDRFRDEFSNDFRNNNPNETDEFCYNLALHDLNRRFIRQNESPEKFNIPMPANYGLPPPVAPPRLPVQQAFALNEAQQRGFDRIMAAARNRIRDANFDRCFVVIGPGGSGKTTLYKHIIEACRAENLNIQVFATTGIAATMMEGGKTVHSGFGFLPGMHSRTLPYLEPDSRKANLLKLAHVILIDEITMLNFDGLRLVNDTLQLIMNEYELPFGGKTIVVGGDFRQLLPVVPGASRAGIIAMTVTKNPLWRRFRIISLTVNMRAQNDPEFVDWLLRVGTGNIPNIPELEYVNTIEIPQELLLQVPEEINPRVRLQNECSHELATMITAIFGENIANLTRDELSSRAILATTVNQVTMVNNHIIEQMDGQIKHYFSIDRIDDPHGHGIAANYPMEYLYSQQPSGLPPHDLGLKVGCVVMLIRNLSNEDGLSNGTRLIVTAMRNFGVEAEILSESHRGDFCFIPMIELDSTQGLPFKMFRLQLPLILSYAMTINKCQGQTLDHVGIYLNDVVFSHGQLYVALSRSRTKRNIKIYVNDCGSRQGHLLRRHAGQENRVFTRNVVYKDVFLHNELEELTERLPEEHINAELAQLLEEDYIQEQIEIDERYAESQQFNDNNIHSYEGPIVNPQQVVNAQEDDDDEDDNESPDPSQYFEDSEFLLRLYADPGYENMMSDYGL